MLLKELYNKPIERAVNPAVSVTKMDDAEVTKVEIDEYVFTDEIINGLYLILNSIRNNKKFSHIGIWIDGYYGSGKSHFLKYLNYCINPATREKALTRLTEAVREADDITNDDHNIEFTLADLTELTSWIRRANVDTIPLNLETSSDKSVDKRASFLNVFWNKFNGHRGLNPFHLTAAQLLEKPLQEKGLFDEFKQRIADDLEGDWTDENQAADMVDLYLEEVLSIAKDLLPTLDTKNIYERISKRDISITIERFAKELADYLADKGEDYRLIFLADEVSQFINSDQDRYLNLQELVTKLSEACGNKVWIACTAQQDLSDIISGCNIDDREGKIKGRFEVTVAFKGAQSDYITRKRILDKKDSVKDNLRTLFREESAGFKNVFKLPRNFDTFETEEDYINYYPFQPYQLKLIQNVFDAFLRLGYVAREVKGNERSIIKVIHSTAKETAERELGFYWKSRCRLTPFGGKM